MRGLYDRVTSNMYFQFIYGAAGIYLFAFMSPIIHEKLLKHKYQSVTYQQEQLFPYPVALVIFPYLAGWLIGFCVKKCSKIPTTEIPRKNVVYCAGAVVIATLTYNIAIVETSYPVVIMVKSCSILSVMIVGVFCTRVRDQHNKLGKNKLIVGALVTMGIILFNLYAKPKEGDKSVTLFGVVLLLVSLVADGFLPDFQAEIKTVYKPAPIDLMSQINKWAFILSVSYSIVQMQLLPILLYMVDHPQFTRDIIYMSVMSTIVQMFVYYLIQKFRQHIVPFIITVRKIFSVVLSILWFEHPLNITQVLGIIVVFGAAIVDFVYEKYYAPKNQQQHGLQHLPSRDDKSTIQMHQTFSDKSDLGSITVQDSVDLEVEVREDRQTKAGSQVKSETTEGEAQ